MAATGTVILNVVARDFASATLRGIGRSGESLANRLSRVGRRMTLAFTVPVVGLAAGAIRSTAQFEKSMALVEVAAQRAGQDTAQLRDELRALALEMTKTTIFDLQETSEAMLELARAGVTTAKEMEAALPAALDLAAAGELDVQEATRGLVNVLSQFEVGADQATAAADALARGAVVSTADVQDMILAFSYVGPLAREMGLSINDAAVAISMMSDSGVRGGRAGRGLRQVLKSLVDPSKEAKKQLQSLGVSIADAEGNIRPFPEILEDLRKALYEESQVTQTLNSRYAVSAKRVENARKVVRDYDRDIQILYHSLESARKRVTKTDSSWESQQASILRVQRAIDALNEKYAEAQRVLAQASGASEKQVTVTRKLTPEQREVALATIFTSRSLSAVIPLIRGGKEGWEKYGKELEAAASAKEQARRVTDTFIGALQRLRNVVTVLAVKTILPFVEDVLTPMIRTFTDIVSQIDTLDPRITKFGLALMGVAAVIGPMIVGMSYLVRVFGIVLSPMGLLTGLFSLLTAAMISNVGGVRDWAVSLLVSGKKVDQFKRGVDAFKRVLKETRDPIQALQNGLEEFGDIGERFAVAIGEMRTKLKEIYDAIRSGDPEAAREAVRELFTTFSDAFGDEAEAAKPKLKAKIQEIMKSLATWWKEEGGRQVALALVAVGDEITAAIIRNILQPASLLLLRGGFALARYLTVGMLAGIRQLFLGGVGAEDYGKKISDWMAANLPATHEAVMAWDAEFARVWDEEAAKLGGELSGAWTTTLKEAFGTTDYSEIAIAFFGAFGKGLWKESGKVSAAFADAIIEGWKQDIENTRRLFVFMFERGQELMKEFIRGMLAGLNVAGAILGNNLQGLVEPIPGGTGSEGTSGFGGRLSGFGGSTPDLSGFGGGPAYQFGGRFIARKPTTFLAGEAAPELVTVTPLHRPDVAPPSQQVNFNLRLEIGTLIGDDRAIDLLTQRVQEALRREARYGFALAR